MFSRTDRLLKLVSRSFSLCIGMLPKKVKRNVGNFYLLCRYADSIEDSSLTHEDKAGYFKEFCDCVKKENPSKIRKLNEQLLPYVIDVHDKELISQFDKVLKEFVGFDSETKKISKKWLSSMVRGMKKYSRKDIETFADLNNYCYFVAGTVGMYLTEVFEYKFNIAKKVGLSKRAKHFGLLLQKVNIIRDFSKDYKEGRVFWPKNLFKKHNISVENVFDEKNSAVRKQILGEMVKNAHREVAKSVEYIELLPKNEKTLRAACAIPFCMALPTLLKCDDNEQVFDSREKVKINREETIRIVNLIKSNVDENKFIRDYCESLGIKGQ